MLFVSMIVAVAVLGFFGLIISLGAAFEKDEKNQSTAFGATIVCFVLAFAVLWAGSGMKNPWIAEAHDNAFRKGYEAYKVGVTSNSNPYQGIRGHAAESQLWLDGWMKAKREGK